jgi:hypothetical protein
MTEDHEPINPKIHDHLTGLGYEFAHDAAHSWMHPEHTTYHREIERDHDVTPTGISVTVYRDGSIRIGGLPDSHTADLLRFLAIALDKGEADDQH